MIDHTGINVSDLKKSLPFYQAALMITPPTTGPLCGTQTATTLKWFAINNPHPKTVGLKN